MLGGIFFKVLLKEAVAKTNIPATCKTFAEVPQDTSLGRLVNALKCEVKAGRLGKKFRKWFDETQGKQGDLQYRFTGKEPRLLTFLSQEKDSQKQQQTMLALAYVGSRLRDLCSIINRFEVEDTHPEQLQILAQEYYHANALLLPTSVNPTIWTIGHVVPAHARQVYDKYGQGLLTVTMEGREAKHIALQKLSVNMT